MFMLVVIVSVRVPGGQDGVFVESPGVGGRRDNQAAVADAQHHIVVVLDAGQVRHYVHVVVFREDIHARSRCGGDAPAPSGDPPVEADWLGVPASSPAVAKDQDAASQQLHRGGVDGLVDLSQHITVAGRVDQLGELVDAGMALVPHVPQQRSAVPIHG